MRFRTKDQSASFSMHRINVDLLDKLADSGLAQEKLEVVRKILPHLSLIELKWLTRIILKDLKLGIGHETVLKNYHRHAIDIYNATSDLKAVFTEVDDYEAVMKAGKPTVFKMFFPIRPMLAGRVASLPQLSDLVTSKGRVLVETKFDGERIQCHLQDMHVMFFSRNGKDYSSLYGPSLAGLIRENVKVKAAILDGEVVVVDSVTGKMQAFGSNKVVALQQ